MQQLPLTLVVFASKLQGHCLCRLTSVQGLSIHGASKSIPSYYPWHSLLQRPHETLLLEKKSFFPPDRFLCIALSVLEFTL